MPHVLVLHRMQCFQNVFVFVNAAAYTPLPVAAQLTLAFQMVVTGPLLLPLPLSHNPTSTSPHSFQAPSPQPN